MNIYSYTTTIIVAMSSFQNVESTLEIKTKPNESSSLRDLQESTQLIDGLSTMSLITSDKRVDSRPKFVKFSRSMKEKLHTSSLEKSVHRHLIYRRSTGRTTKCKPVKKVKCKTIKSRRCLPLRITKRLWKYEIAEWHAISAITITFSHFIADSMENK